LFGCLNYKSKNYKYKKEGGREGGREGEREEGIDVLFI
jgi:hypothetical protein